MVAGTRTAESYIAYDDAGSAVCFYDPGDAHGDGLGDEQRDAVARADVVCLTVAPAAATREALDAASDDAQVVWSVKADPDAYPKDLVQRLLERADVVAWAHGERGFVEGEPRDDALVVETRGARGVAWWRSGRSAELAVEPIRVADTTGAGDALVAGVIAQLLRDPQDEEAAVAAGIDSSRALLQERTEATA